MKAQDIVNLITMRDFMFRSVDNILIPMSREEISLFQQRLKLIDKKIIESINKLDLNTLEVPKLKEDKKLSKVKDESSVSIG